MGLEKEVAYCAKDFIFKMRPWPGYGVCIAQQLPGTNTVVVNPADYSPLYAHPEYGQIFIHNGVRDAICRVNRMHDVNELYWLCLEAIGPGGPLPDQADKARIHPVVDVANMQHSDP